MPQTDDPQSPREAQSSNPPPIAGVRRSFVTARGVRFHVTETGPADARPVVVLHGWPQHHLAYRDLLADPPAGLRIIAPDLPGYGWSGPAPHRWEKQEVAADLLALLDALGLDRVLLVGHDWGGFIGFLMVLGNPERFDGFVPLNIAHPWQTRKTIGPHAWRFLYQPLVASVGTPLQRYTPFLRLVYRLGVSTPGAIPPEVLDSYMARFRDPVVAHTGAQTYRTFLLHEIAAERRPRRRRPTLPIRALFGRRDRAIHYSLAAAETARADDYTVEYISDCGHFTPEERPDLVRQRLVELAAATAGPAA